MRKTVGDGDLIDTSKAFPPVAFRVVGFLRAPPKCGHACGAVVQDELLEKPLDRIKRRAPLGRNLAALVAVLRCR